jgi:hypothetical protein
MKRVAGSVIPAAILSAEPVVKIIMLQGRKAIASLLVY